MELLVFLMIGVPIILFIVSIIFFIQKDTKKGKLFLILMGVYLLVAFGICGIMLANFTLDTKWDQLNCQRPTIYGLVSSYGRSSTPCRPTPRAYRFALFLACGVLRKANGQKYWSLGMDLSVRQAGVKDLFPKWNIKTWLWILFFP